ncbi:tRNA (N(6)-L-threonylcarbamoyladenosine(37)-C(2))-methylthiotransferase MtaB [Candidatus Bipolaricaulota bacterium]|nr:tRNA (N(6)-L-threonylcarbamoyladenosine(37)-C(2))-methylthiotransferase MtaB [Candidatus Bipolaricaulota bacterium]
MTKKVAFYTLGCKANQYDTEIMKDALRGKQDYRVVAFSENPDVAFINTCSVTGGADRKSRKYIRRAVRKGALVLVTGCYTTLDSDEIADISGVDVIFPNSQKYGVAEIMSRAESGFRGKVKDTEGPNWDLDQRVISRDSNHTRAFLKIQDGCSNACTFCKVHYLRGPTRSKSRPRVIEEASKLGDNGFREIVLTGINLAEYGEETGGLAELIRGLSRVEKISRIRLSSINPDGITGDLLEAFKDSEKTCPYFHVPLQSGSDNILNAMNRGYSREYYLRKIDSIRSYLPESTIGTDLMVGFPGEKERDYLRTKETVREVGLINGHVFRYSPRPVTPASDFEDKVDSSVKKRRAKELRSLVSSISLDRKRKFKGNSLDMIIEEPSNKVDGWRGHSKNYLDIHFRQEGQIGELEPGETVKVNVTKAKEDFCLAESLKSARGCQKVSKVVEAGKEKSRE